MNSGFNKSSLEQASDLESPLDSWHDLKFISWVPYNSPTPSRNDTITSERQPNRYWLDIKPEIEPFWLDHAEIQKK